MRFYELFIGFRYLKSKKGQGLVSSNTVISIFLVFFGVFMLIVVLSVMNGFQSAIKDKILDVDTHITVSKTYGLSSIQGIRNYNSVMEKLEPIDEVTSVEAFIFSQGLFRWDTLISPVMIRGVGVNGQIPENVKKFIVKDEVNFIEGERSVLPEQFVKDFFGTRSVLIGQQMAYDNSILIGDYIELIVPKGRLVTTTGVIPGLGRFKVIGFFKTEYYDYDTKLIIMSLPQAQRLFAVGDIVSGIGVKIKDVYQMDIIANEIRAILGNQFVTLTSEEKNRNLFYALQLEKLLMMIILFLVIMSAGFTIMGTLVMIVTEKRKAIGVLKSMGAKPNSIMVIFILEGFMIGIVGTLVGVIFGLATALNLDAIITWIEDFINNLMTNIYTFFNWELFEKIRLVPDKVYYIEGIPTLVKPELIVFIAIVAVFLCALASIFPAWSASRLKPVETIRYE